MHTAPNDDGLEPREAEACEMLARALAPHADPQGCALLGPIVLRLQTSDPELARAVRHRAQALVVQGAPMTTRGWYFTLYRHGEVELAGPRRHHALDAPRWTMGKGTQAFVTGCHSVDEATAIADQRAQALAEGLRQRLPASRTVTVMPHRCNAVCGNRGELLHGARHVTVRVSLRAEALPVGVFARRAAQLREAMGREPASGPERPASAERASALQPLPADARVDIGSAARQLAAELQALWVDLLPDHEAFRYETVSSLVTAITPTDPSRAQRIAARLRVLTTHPDAPEGLVERDGVSLVFAPGSADPGPGELARLDRLLERFLPSRDELTTVLARGGHDADEDPALADRRARQVIAAVELRRPSGMVTGVTPHRCEVHCRPKPLPFQRRVVWVRAWRPLGGLTVEDIRVAALPPP